MGGQWGEGYSNSPPFLRGPQDFLKIQTQPTGSHSKLRKDSMKGAEKPTLQKPTYDRLPVMCRGAGDIPTAAGEK